MVWDHFGAGQMMHSQIFRVYHRFIGYDIILHTIIHPHPENMPLLTGISGLTDKIQHTQMSKSMNIIVLSVLLITKMSCSSLDAKDCEVREIKTLFTTVGIHDRDTAYAHYTLIKGFSRECMDSVTMVNLALKYSDTVKTGRPADIIMFFNSDENFISNETSQVMEEINKSCLVVIGLDVKAKMPNDFIFYNKKGERVYWGNRWLPNGK